MDFAELLDRVVREFDLRSRNRLAAIGVAKISETATDRVLFDDNYFVTFQVLAAKCVFVLERDGVDCNINFEPVRQQIGIDQHHRLLIDRNRQLSITLQIKSPPTE